MPIQCRLVPKPISGARVSFNEVRLAVSASDTNVLLLWER